MTRVGRAVEKGETQGFMKVVVDAETKEILGAAILGVGGDEAIHGILDVMSAKAPYTRLQRDHAHPPDRLGADPDHARRDEAAGVRCAGVRSEGAPAVVACRLALPPGHSANPVAPSPIRRYGIAMHSTSIKTSLVVGQLTAARPKRVRVKIEVAATE